MTNHVPRFAQRAAPLVQRVLSIADQAGSAPQEDEIRSAAGAIRLAPDDPLLEVWVAASEGRLLNQAAGVALRGGSVQEALSLQMKAFGANPLDPDIARNLALLQLRQRPPQADAARQLALSALVMRDSRQLSGGIEDWTALAIASALSGRNRDARNAWLVTVALTPSLERQCKAAVNAYARYGERLRYSVETMLYRVHSSGRSDRSVFCEWPAHWMATSPMR
jgi:hypothetical protein